MNNIDRIQEYIQDAVINLKCNGMELQTVNIDNKELVPSGASREGISVRRSGIAKILWRKLNTEVPASKVIAGGVDIYKG